MSFWDQPLSELLADLEVTRSGLTSGEAALRLRRYGPNAMTREKRFAGLLAFFGSFTNPLVMILVVASAISITLGDAVGGLVILAMILLSVVLNFTMEFQARHAMNEIAKQVATNAAVVRDGAEVELPVAVIVPGDILHLNAGDLVPADARLLEVKDLRVRESALTGESLAVEKVAADLGSGGARAVADATNSVFLGTAIQTGIGVAVVVRTGKETELGEIASRLAEHPPETEFTRGIRHFGLMITRVILALVLFVLLVNIILKRPLLESFLFSVALAVGMTPEMMPMIITISLAQGARRMARKKVLVKQLAAIEDFGSITILCSDKTGTLTEGEIELDRHVDVDGKPDEGVFRIAYLNSSLQAGIQSPLDAAILRHDKPDVHDFRKVDEVPFDFHRKRLTVVARREGASTCTLCTKGDVESVLAVCGSVIVGQDARPLDDAFRERAMQTFRDLSADGFRVLGIATCEVLEAKAPFTIADETAMTLVGFAAFLDPPKAGVREILADLQSNGVSVVIMTGDNQYVTQKVAKDVGLPVDRIVTGVDVDAMDDAALAYQARNGVIFARMSPEQKNRVILALKAQGQVVGYIGDGINDAPSLHTADVGISVMNGVEVAKDAAKIILLEKDLAVLHDGIVEGRRCFANIMKYVVMGTSSNFGNMFSMAAASLFLPFLPMLPMQILLNNFLYDVSQVSIPSDQVDDELLHTPKRWRISFIRQFMMIIGPISSIYDFLTFGVLLYGFHAASNAPLFHTAWFVESLATQTLVVFVIRTAGSPLRSRPSRQLALTVLTVVLIAMVLPYTPLGTVLGFVPLPGVLLASIVGLAVTYLMVVQVVKSWFYRRHALL
jgi:Mg2+-importing ATPase